MNMMSIADFKSHALQIIEHIFQTREELVITKGGKPVAKIVFYEQESSKSQLGKLSKYFISESDIISPVFPEDWDAEVGK